MKCDLKKIYIYIYPFYNICLHLKKNQTKNINYKKNPTNYSVYK